MLQTPAERAKRSSLRISKGRSNTTPEKGLKNPRKVPQDDEESRETDSTARSRKKKTLATKRKRHVDESEDTRETESTESSGNNVATNKRKRRSQNDNRKKKPKYMIEPDRDAIITATELTATELKVIEALDQIFTMGTTTALTWEGLFNRDLKNTLDCSFDEFDKIRYVIVHNIYLSIFIAEYAFLIGSCIGVIFTLRIFPDVKT